MDLLGSIMNSMTKPPSGGLTKERQQQKKEAERLKKIQEEEKKKLQKFRSDIEERINKFLADDFQNKIKFDHMPKHLRGIIHDVVDVAGLTAFSFGIEDIDRHVIVYKNDSVPDEDELAALRKGEVYDPEKAALERQMREEEERERLSKAKKEKIVPKNDYSEKYEHLIGREAGKQAAQATTTNKQFGLVPSAAKRDQRSIEQTLADMRQKKKQRTDGESSSTTNTGHNESYEQSD